jgi:hypothetical protein
MSSLPSPEEQTWLLDQLRDLIARRGYETFVNAPILEPSDAYFPDPFSHDTRGIYVLARRLLSYAGLGHLDVHVQVFPDGALDPTHDGRETVAWFGGIVDERCLFGANLRLLQNLEPLPGAMAHEVAHAFRAFHQLQTPDSAEEELLTDLTTIYLGFGVLTTNTSYIYRASSHLVGYTAVTKWAQQRYGYLPPQALSFVLAAQAVARQLTSRSRGRLAALLESNQAEYFRAAVKHLSAADGELARRLCIPPRETWPPAPELGELVKPLENVPAPHSFEALPVQPKPDPREANRGRRVFRVTATHALRDAVLFTLATGLTAGVLAPALGSGGRSFWPWLLVPVGLALGWLNGRATPRNYCSDPECAASLPPDVTLCSGCGGTVAGDISRPKDRLAAEDRLRELEAGTPSPGLED